MLDNNIESTVALGNNRIFHHSDLVPRSILHTRPTPIIRGPRPSHTEIADRQTHPLPTENLTCTTAKQWHAGRVVQSRTQGTGQEQIRSSIT